MMIQIYQKNKRIYSPISHQEVKGHSKQQSEAVRPSEKKLMSNKMKEADINKNNNANQSAVGKGNVHSGPSLVERGGGQLDNLKTSTAVKRVAEAAEKEQAREEKNTSVVKKRKEVSEETFLG